MDRFLQWKNILGITENDDNFVHENYRVCDKHFESRYKYKSKKLTKTAVPTLNLSTSVHIARPLQEIDLNLPHTSETSESAEPSSSTGVSKKQFERDSKNLEQACGIQSSTSIVAVTKKNTFEKKRGRQGQYCFSSLERELKKELNKLTKQVNYGKKRIQIYKKRLQAAKSFRQKCLENVIKSMSPAAKLLFKMQARESKKRGVHGRRFFKKEKLLALSLYKQGPKVYNLLAKLCILPSKSTLTNMLRKVKLNTGFNENLFEQLKNLVKKMEPQDRLCSVIFDEMAIAPNLQYDTTDDKIIGFTTVEHGTKTIADHVLVFMVVGIVKKFKQPVWFTFTDKSVKAHHLKMIIKDVIRAVIKTGLRVCCTICDQAQTFRSAINSLIDDTKAEYLRIGQEFHEVFEVNGKQIIPLYDPPHLLKGIRNNLLTKPLHAKMDGKNIIAKWEHIQKAYELNPNFRGLSLLFKLSDYHVIPSRIKKMKVKHAAQVFSSNVGVNIGFMADIGVLPKECADTAQILILFDQLFDTMNASFSHVRDGKIYRVALTPKSIHHEFWKKALIILDTIKFEATKINKRTGVVKKTLQTVPSVISWIKTIKGLQLLQRKLLGHNVCSILTRHLNQDPLENTFAWIRSHGVRNINPTATSFVASYKSLLISKYVSKHSLAANCEEDTFKCLKTMDKLLFSKSSGQIRNVLNIEIDENHIFLTSENEGGALESAVLEYVAGYMGRICKRVFKNCLNCNSNLFTSTRSDNAYILKREYQTGKAFLNYPSQNLVEFVKNINLITFRVLGDKAAISNIGSYIQLIVSINVDFSFIHCSEHKHELIKFISNYCVNFFLNRYCKIVNEILVGKRSQFDQHDLVQIAASKYFNEKKKIKNRN